MPNFSKNSIINNELIGSDPDYNERFQIVSDKIKAELFPLLERDGVAQAMQLPEITDAVAAKAMISENFVYFVKETKI